ERPCSPARRGRGESAEFHPTFARRMIDEGADLVVGHGPHLLRGMEIHKGRPIFYSLGDFVGQKSFPADRRFRETVGPMCCFTDGRLSGLEIRPVTLGPEEKTYLRGRPRLAGGEEARRILERFASLSEPFGTHLEICDDVATLAS